MARISRTGGTGITDTSRSPHCRLRPVPLGAVQLTGGFWADRLETNRKVTIPVLLERLREHHVLDNFLRIYGAKDCPRERRLATDTDLYKWLEGVCYAIANRPDAQLRAMVDEAADIILPAQEESGYLNTAFVDENRDKRWQQLHGHELYTAGTCSRQPSPTTGPRARSGSFRPPAALPTTCGTCSAPASGNGIRAIRRWSWRWSSSTARRARPDTWS